MKRKVLVSGATGQQGGSVMKALLQAGHVVTGITRNTDAQKAKSLEAAGATMISVDFTNHDLLVDAMRQVDTVFSMTTPFEAGIEAEIEQGKTMAHAAELAGVDHFIYSSVADADRHTHIPHFDSKFEVEKYLAGLKLNTTIVAPTYFMDNLLFFNMDGLKQGMLGMAMPGDVKLQQISVEDIGKMVARVVNERELWFGKRINIAGDELSGDEAAAILSKVIGKNIRYESFSIDVVRSQSEDLAAMYEWFVDDGYTSDLGKLKPYGFTNFESWAAGQDWSMIR